MERSGVEPGRWRAYRAVSWTLTFVAVVVAWVFFRAESLASAVVIVQAMFGFGAAFAVPAESILLGWMPVVRVSAGELRHWWGDRQLIELAVLMLAVVALPNSQQLIARAESWCATSTRVLRRGATLRAGWLGVLASAIMFLTVITHSKTVSEFIYFNF